MNQIIYPENLNDNFKRYDEYIKIKKNTYKYIFIFAIFFLIAFISYYLWHYFKISKKENISNRILKVYDIQKLYAENKSIEIPSVISETGDVAEILGIIEIDKIYLRYPILSKTTDEFLEIAPCKFAGNTLNGYGNFCIAGHNFDNDTFFSNLNRLEIGDTIRLYSLSGNSILYTVYDKFEIAPSDTSCTKQTNKIKEITLVTCNNKNKKRLVIKAKIDSQKLSINTFKLHYIL